MPTNFKEGEGIAFFQLHGTWLGLYPPDALAEDACLPPERASFGGMTLAHNVIIREEVDRVIALRLWLLAHFYSNRLPTPSGVVIPVILQTRMVTSGKWPGTHSFLWSRS